MPVERYIREKSNGGADVAEILDGSTPRLEVAVDPANATALTALVGDEATLVQGAAGLCQVQLGAASGWAKLTGFTAAPASTSTITMTTDWTAMVKPRQALRYTIGGVSYYGIVTAIAANLLTVAGAPLSGTVTALFWGRHQAFPAYVNIPGTYNGSVRDLIANVANGGFPWVEETAYLVAFRARHKTPASSQPKVNVKLNGNLVSTNDTAAGITMSGSVSTDVVNSAVAISTTNYKILPGEELEIRCTSAGTGDAKDLTVSMTFVKE